MMGVIYGNEDVAHQKLKGEARVDRFHPESSFIALCVCVCVCDGLTSPEQR